MEVNKESDCIIIRCKASTDANKLAGSIYSAYKDNQDKTLVVRVIGAGSLNQATKAVIIANKFFSKKGIILDVRPSFCDVSDDMTAVNLRIIFSRV